MLEVREVLDFLPSFDNRGMLFQPWRIARALAGGWLHSVVHAVVNPCLAPPEGTSAADR